MRFLIQQSAALRLTMMIARQAIIYSILGYKFRAYFAFFRITTLYFSTVLLDFKTSVETSFIVNTLTLF